MNSKPLSKKQCERLHARKRFFERYGLNFNNKIERLFLQIIKDGKARLVERQTNRVIILDVYYKLKPYRIVFDKKRKAIITALPKSCISRGV